MLGRDDLLCAECIHELPFTGFEKLPGNAVENIFTGRVKIEEAFSLLYFTKGKMAQQLLHELKYKRNIAIGEYLGSMMGEKMEESTRFTNIEGLIPLPLFAGKESKRGYNQAAVICRGIHRKTKTELIDKNVIRKRSTETQTRKHRTERWENVQGSFTVTKPSALEGKHLLLVDDVLTTGATLEACAEKLLAIPGVKVSLATIAVAAK